MPPVLVREEALVGTGFLPGDRDQIYEVPKDELFLVGTSEVPLAGLHADQILDAAELPLRYAGFSTCFRREAGAAGRDTRGIFRVHQFDKVEMFSFVEPSMSAEEHERLLAIEERILTELEIPYRVVSVAAGDLGAPAAKKYDCEAWIPSQERYRELTSCSNTTDYQARRLSCRYRSADGEAPEVVHTLNGTAVAVGRTMIALIENRQERDGGFTLPSILHSYGAPEKIGSRVTMSTSVREAKRVVLCDDHEIVREAIKARMASSNVLDIVGEAGNGRDVVDVVKELEPDVLIIDVELPKRDGIEATKEVLKVRPRTKVIIFTAHAQPDLLALALRAGASGYVLKSAPAEDIARAVKAVTGGGTFLGGDFAGGKPSEVEKLLDLSPRERQILELLAEGLRVKEIAERLQLSPATVHTHVRNAIAKLEVDTRTEAVALAVRFSYLGAGGAVKSRSLLFVERQGAAVDAVALAARVGRAVVEDVAEVGVAGLADDLGAPHEQAVVGPQFDVLEVGRLGEARPAGARVELGVGGEELGAAADAAVHALRLLVDVGAGEGTLGARLAGHLVLLGRQLLTPLLL